MPVHSRFMDDTNKTPDTTPDTHPTSELAATPAPAQQPVAAAPERRTRARGWLIAGGAVLAGALLAGGGVAVGAAIADEAGDDDAAAAVAEDSDEDTSRSSSGQTAADADDADDADASDGAPSDVGTTSADDLITAMDAATAAADGEPVSIELQRDGAVDVTLEAADGAETEVRVSAEGEASVVSTEPAESNDQGATVVLDADAIRSLVEAALAEQDGRIVEIDVDDDTTSPYEVSVVTGDRATVDVHLDADFAVVPAGSDG